MTRIFMLLLCAFCATASHLYAQDTLRTFIFGHSLINHELQVNPTPSQETSVPHWFHFLAEEAGRGYAVSGQYGFIPQHASNLPPFAQWGFDHVASAWDSDNEPFSDADFDNILITPGNFIQWQGPSVPYFNDSLSPITYTNMVFDWVTQQESGLNLYIYENWPDMAGYLNAGFPPTPQEWADYNNYLTGDFHDWFLEYHDALIQAQPDHCVRMIPSGPVISNLLMQSPFDQIAIDTLYEDDAPHGRPTIYFLAALVTYMAMYEEPAPSSYTVPAIIDPIVANNYQQAVDFIWGELQAFDDGNGDSRVFCSEPITGLEEASPLQNELNLFPNPTSGTVNINGAGNAVAIELLDLSGRNIRSIQPAASATLDLTALPNAVYLVKITSASGSVEHRKLVKF